MMRTVRKTILVCAVTCLMLLVSGQARADWEPGDPYKMHYPQLPDPNGWDVSVMTPNRIADDFLCTQSGLITDVHLWASAQGDYGYPYPDTGDGLVGIVLLEPPAVEVQVHLSVHSDIPDPDGSGPLYSMPGDLLWEWNTFDATIVPVPIPGLQGWYDPIGGNWAPEDHQFYFQVNIDIPEAEAFYQEAGTTYWLDVQVSVFQANHLTDFTDGIDGFLLPQFGWKTSLDYWNDDAVYMDAQGVWQELLDPATGESLDMAFVITPEPITLAVLVLGMVLAALHKRRRSL